MSWRPNLMKPEEIKHFLVILDIVLLSADSLRTIKKTHSSYFAGRNGQAEWLEEVHRYLPSTFYRQAERAYEHVRSGHGRRLSGPPPR